MRSSERAARRWRAVRTLVFVVLAFGTYRLGISPWLVPESPPRRDARVQGSGPRGLPPIEHYREHLAQLFDVQRWELGNPQILKSDRAMMLMQSYSAMADGRLRIEPCTVLFFPEGLRAWRSGRSGPPVILQATGAMLQFDGGVDPRRAELGRLIQGQLEGPIRIFRPKQHPQDAYLEISTQTLQIDRQRIWTAGEVEFQWGESWGRGRDLIVMLAEEGEEQPGMGPLGHLESIELVRVDELKLVGVELWRDRLAGETPVDPPVTSEPRTLNVRCQGSIRLDVRTQVLTAEDRVHLFRTGPATQTRPDELWCHFLQVYGERSAMGTPSDAPFSTGITATRIVATGNAERPVRMEFPSVGLSSQAARMEFDLQAQQLELAAASGSTAWLRDRDHWMAAPQMRLRRGNADEVGEFSARGPGQYRGLLEDSAVEASWQESIEFGPFEDHHRLSARGDVELSAANLGNLKTQQLDLDLRLLRRTPEIDGPTTRRMSLRPTHLLAQGSVQLRSTFLSANGNRLEIDVVPHRWPVPEGEAGEPSTSTVGPDRPQQEAGEGPTHRPLKIAAAEVKAVVSLPPIGPEVHRVEMTGQVEIETESDGSLAATPPMRIVGDRARVERASGDWQAVVEGAPAHLEGRGLHLWASNVNMDQQHNRIWIVGPGRLAAPADRLGPASTSTATRSAQPGWAYLQWDDNMDFDGLHANVFGNVWLASPHYRVHLDRVEVQLNEGILLRDPPRDPSAIKVRRLRGFGVVDGERRMVHADGTYSWEKFQLGNIELDQVSGELTVNGPGWISSVHPARHSWGPLPRGGASGASATGGLEYLRVDFARQLTGNIFQQHVTLADEVRVVVGPVADWHQQLQFGPPEQLPPDTYQLRSDLLTVSQVPGSTRGAGPWGLVATGNTHIWGPQLHASGQRASYDQAKDLLVLEGDGLVRAQLATSLTGRRGHVSALKILYQPSTGQLHLDHGDQFELTGFGSAADAPPVGAAASGAARPAR